MSRIFKAFCQLLLIGLISMIWADPVKAIPPLPSSFYGTIQVNDQNVPDGTLVSAWINDSVVASGHTQTYKGDSVYALDIPGDDTTTSPKDGGLDQESISFKVGGALANETGAWRSGTNVRLNLTVSTSAVIQQPEATPSPMPTQTAIVDPASEATPTATTQSPALALSTDPPDPTTASPDSIPLQPAEPSPAATQVAPATATPAVAAQSNPETGSLKPSPTLSATSTPTTMVVTESDTWRDPSSGAMGGLVIAAAVFLAWIVGMRVNSNKQKSSSTK